MRRSYRPGRAHRSGPSLALLAVLLALAGCDVRVAARGAGAAVAAPSVGQGDVPAGTLDPSAASAALVALPVAEKTPLDGYERGCGEGEGCVFGPAWADVDRNGCDQRNDVLHRDLTDVQVREGTQGCVVVAGVLDDPYTGATVPVREGRRGRGADRPRRPAGRRLGAGRGGVDAGASAPSSPTTSPT